MDITIRRATTDEANVLTEIAHAAKRHWGYPENWIKHWKNDLTITSEFIANHETFVAVAGEEIVGCCALVVTESGAELEHMWIKPEYMGASVGRALFLHLTERARGLGLRALEISSDPNAEGFYRHMGAMRIGDVQSGIEGQPRILPRMMVALESVDKQDRRAEDCD